MGHHHQTGHQLAEPSPEHLHTDAVWGHDGSVHKGTPQYSVCVHILNFVCFIDTQRLNSVDLFPTETRGWKWRLAAQTGENTDAVVYYTSVDDILFIALVIFFMMITKIKCLLSFVIQWFDIWCFICMCFNWLIFCVSSEREASVF